MDSAKTLEFISLIQERPELWQKENRDFMNREIRARIFSEVADMIGISGNCFSTASRGSIPLGTH